MDDSGLIDSAKERGQRRKNCKNEREMIVFWSLSIFLMVIMIQLLSKYYICKRRIQLYKQDQMLRFLKAQTMYSKIKPLKINILSTDFPMRVQSPTTNHKWEVKSALENLLSCLVACEVATLKDLSRKQNIKIHNIKFHRVESEYDLSKYIKGGPENKINDIIIEAQIETSCSQQELDTLHERVENSCPVFQMLSKSGVRIKNNWKNIQI